MLARREGGDAAFERYFAALARRLHDLNEPVETTTYRAAAEDAEMPGVIERARSDPRAAEDVEAAYEAARREDVFGVPTLSLDGSKVMYGPIIPTAPEGDETLALWEHVRWLLMRPDFFELKRWPRNVRPGAARVTEP
jgi:hypothetical protein